MANKKTVLIKISGESIKSDKSTFDSLRLNELANQIKKIQTKYNVGIILGGGNIMRGASFKSNLICRTTTDQMGMLATIINSLALRDSLENAGIKTKLYSLIAMPTIAHTYSIHQMNHDLRNNHVIIFAGGTGNPYFSTDTGIALRTLETKADIVLMGKNGVDGIYSDDPRTNKKAKRYSSISYDEIIKQDLKVMDMTAIPLFAQANARILVFDTNTKDCYLKALANKIPSTSIYKKGK